LTDYEVDELVKALRSFGVLTREDLLESSGARHWAGSTFDSALRRGTAAGSIKDLGAGLFEAGDDASDPNEGQFDPS
jgi:hypothetical protein